MEEGRGNSERIFVEILKFEDLMKSCSKELFDKLVRKTFWLVEMVSIKNFKQKTF